MQPGFLENESHVCFLVEFRIELSLTTVPGNSLFRQPNVRGAGEYRRHAKLSHAKLSDDAALLNDTNRAKGQKVL